MTPVDRRHFLRNSAALAAGLTALGPIARAGDEADAKDKDKGGDARKPGPNDTVRMAVIGVRGRGMEHIAGLTHLKDVRITTICDVDRNVIGKAMTTVE